jgi:monoamine oxidase
MHYVQNIDEINCRGSVKKNKTDIIIIGGGLTGLAIAYHLRGSNYNIRILEARDRIGGRIFTTRDDIGPPIELGATWIGTAHTELFALLKELDIEVFEQKFGNTAIYEPISTSPPQLVRLPPNSDPSYRIKGGSDRVIQKFASYLGESQIYLGQAVQVIQRVGERLIVSTKDAEYSAPIVISTLPPHLFISNIEVRPVLPKDFVVLANNTHTWMGESIKIALTYKEAFWDEEGLSGTIFSSVGPIPEMYDHSSFEEDRFALKGFLNGTYFEISREERLQLILNQLQKYYGKRALDFVKYEEVVWTNETYTSAQYAQHVLPHQNNGHRLYQEAYLGGKLYFAGTETDAAFSGYMEGAIRSAKRACLVINSASED